MRKREMVAVPDDERYARDHGKAFVVTEMSATRAEKWGVRALLLLQGSGAELPQNIHGMGMVGVTIVGLNVFLKGNVDPDKLEPLLDEMMTCVTVVRDLKHPDVDTPIVSDDDVEEVATRLWLRSEVLRVHTGFSPADALSNLMQSITAPASPPN